MLATYLWPTLLIDKTKLSLLLAVLRENTALTVESLRGKERLEFTENLNFGLRQGKSFSTGRGVLISFNIFIYLCYPESMRFLDQGRLLLFTYRNNYISSSALILPSSRVMQWEPDGWACVYKGDSYSTGEEPQSHQSGSFHRTTCTATWPPFWERQINLISLL